MKKTMELIWHDCTECLPKEDFNPCLYMTDGFKVFHVVYKKELGFFYNGYKINPDGHYWADLAQTTIGFFCKTKEK